MQVCVVCVETVMRAVSDRFITPGTICEMGGWGRYQQLRHAISASRGHQSIPGTSVELVGWAEQKTAVQMILVLYFGGERVLVPDT